MKPDASPPLLFFRRRDTAHALAISESLVLQYERRGWLSVVKLPGVRAIRHAREDVEMLARRIRRGEIGDAPAVGRKV
jgi:predicted site-specific integrase-resolvase